jgi:hypothetical protein
MFWTLDCLKPHIKNNQNYRQSVIKISLFDISWIGFKFELKLSSDLFIS